MGRLAMILLLLGTFTLAALTPQEKTILRHARDNAIVARTENQKIKTYVEWADQEIARAWQYAAETKAAAEQTGRDINDAYEREKACAKKVEYMEPFWVAGHKWFGLGAIWLGVQMLLKNLLVLAIVLVVLSGLIWLATLAFPWLKIPLAIVGRFVRFLVDKIKNRKK
jgi:hypothetical protein